MILLKAFQVLEALSETRSRIRKTEILTENADSKRLQRLFEMALNPYVTYGVTVPSKIKTTTKPKGTPVDRWRAFYKLTRKFAARKLTGGAAETAIVEFFGSCHKSEAKWYRAVLNKQLRVGTAHSTVLGVWPKLYPTFGCQTANVAKSVVDVALPVWIERKIDGMRILVIVRDGNVIALSRGGREILTLSEIVKQFARCGDGVYDGEVIAKTWNETVSMVRSTVNVKDVSAIRILLFDFIPLDDFDAGECQITLRERKKMLKVNLLVGQVDEHIRFVPHEVARTHEDIQAAFEKYVAMGYEGVMLKDPDGWYSLDRTDDWLKYKPWDTLDGRIVECVEGAGKHEGRLGAFVVELEDGTEVRVGGGKRGTGMMTDERRDHYWATRKELVGQWIEFEVQADPSAVSVSRFPRLVRFRPDKEN